MSEAKPFVISKWEVWEAYKRVKANKGAAGVDEQSIEDFERNLKGNLYKIWNRMSSGKERDKLLEMTNSHQCHKPIPKLLEGLNRHLKGWSNYFKFGYPRDAFREINWYVGQRLFRHLNRRSQRAFKLPEGTTYYQHFRKLGLEPLMF